MIRGPYTPVRGLDTAMRSLVNGAIRCYQLALSPLVGPACRFYPSCSQYALEAVARFGVLRGGWLAARRLARCHPWHEGGYDPVPPLHLCTHHVQDQ